MAQVQRANVFLTIDDADIEKYMAKGYSVVDEQGNIIRQCVPTSISELQKAYSEHVEKIKQLESQITLLKSQLATAAGDAAVAPKGRTTTRRKSET